MDDTTPEIAEKMHEMIRNKTFLERAEMGCSMYQTSKQLIIRAILEENPSISEISLRQQLFLKFYGNDFNEEEKEKILQYLAL